jgi:hypothetical protein
MFSIWICSCIWVICGVKCICCHSISVLRSIKLSVQFQVMFFPIFLISLRPLFAIELLNFQKVFRLLILIVWIQIIFRLRLIVIDNWLIILCVLLLLCWCFELANFFWICDQVFSALPSLKRSGISRNSSCFGRLVSADVDIPAKHLKAWKCRLWPKLWVLSSFLGLFVQS